MALIYEKAQQLKSEMLKHNSAALRDITRAYKHSWRKLDLELKALTEQIRQEVALGHEVKMSWLMRQQRYQSLIVQIESELSAFGETVVSTIKSQQQLALAFGETRSSVLMKLSMGNPPEEVLRLGLGINWNALPRDAVRNLVGYLADGSPLEYKFIGMPRRVVENVRAEFTSGLIAGKNPREIARMIKKASDGELLNALTTARTETLRAYRQASHETYRANSDVVEGWIWSCAHQARTCAACWAMDGTFHTLDEELNDHPNGRCAAIPKTRSWDDLFPDADLSGVKETGVAPWDSEKYFRKLKAEDQMAILGKQKYELWKSGEIKLSDIPRVEKSKVWGDSVRVGSLDEIKEKIKLGKAA